MLFKAGIGETVGNPPYLFTFRDKPVLPAVNQGTHSSRFAVDSIRALAGRPWALSGLAGHVKSQGTHRLSRRHHHVMCRSREREELAG